MAGTSISPNQGQGLSNVGKPATPVYFLIGELVFKFPGGIVSQIGVWYGMPMNMVMKKSTRIKITQSYQDDCCDGWKNSGKGVKSMRRRVKRMEKRQWLREQD